MQGVASGYLLPMARDPNSEFQAYTESADDNAYISSILMNGFGGL